MEALKSHPFFSGIDLANIYDSKPPIYDISSPYKKKRANSGGDEDEFLTSQVYGFNLMDKVEAQTEKKPSPPKQQQQQTTPTLQIILSGMVLMKDGWFFYKTRKLVLNNQPRLTFFDPDNGILKVIRFSFSHVLG
jgi:hypothetical protein